MKIKTHHMTQLKKSQKKRGRPALDVVDRIRNRLWFDCVKAYGKGDWTNYKLSVEFGLDRSGHNRKGADRLRIFEQLQKHGAPLKPEIVLRVDKHPQFRGTQNYFFSPFWTLLKSKKMSAAEAHDFALDQLSRNGLIRPKSEEEYELLEGSDLEVISNNIRDPLEVYRERLRGFRIQNSEFNSIQVLTLLGALYREAYISCHLKLAVILHEEFMHHLAVFCDWLAPSDSKESDDLFILVQDRVFFWHVQMLDTGEGGENREGFKRLNELVQYPFYQLNDRTRRIIDNFDEERKIFLARFDSELS